ncbi:ATP synthase F0 subunit 8 (mitochondrion) [Phlebotomus papatasi]|uniref:ATP synthase complex subunit 8 n=1 Tax=Phlebotomus papatasi TaxID=29031 RepID=A0A0N9DSP3_PHLPP|nr:ATP synthase F0 subunit 8 [Phlebotomus papatasi]ALF07251.1 ATP synthase F0 subunit 8 [Phlebotomus papatasi]
MPQMAPLMWLSLFLFFLVIYLFFNIINYFSFLPSSKKSESLSKLNKSSMNWKW